LQGKVRTNALADIWLVNTASTGSSRS